MIIVPIVFETNETFSELTRKEYNIYRYIDISKTGNNIYSMITHHRDIIV
jgi:hypothetical protein